MNFAHGVNGARIDDVSFSSVIGVQTTDPGDVLGATKVDKHLALWTFKDSENLWLYLGYRCTRCACVFIVSDLKDLRHRPCL